MKNSILIAHRRIVVIFFLLITPFSKINAQEVGIFEAYPDEFQASLEIRDRELLKIPARLNGMPLRLVLDNLKLWKKDTILVSFNGGDSALHKRIVELMTGPLNWSDFGGVSFDFGFNPATGTYGTWSTSDINYTSDIRISFNYEYSRSGTGMRTLEIITSK